MEALVTTALVGTAQRGGGDALGSESPVDALVAELSAVPLERRLLLQAGARAIYRMAGALPEIGLPAPLPAPPEMLPACSKAAAELIRSMLSGTHPELLPEALERLRRARLRLPFDLLPLALSARDHRDALAPVLGQRGRWLSQFNPAWTWVRGALIRDAGELPENVETIWLEGAAGERIALLRQIRAVDPARARDWVEDVWKREKAEMRADLVQVLEVSLSGDDEAFLEAALDDRSAAVRERAALLLARLPESALAHRMIARADTVLSYDDATLKVKPPTTFEKDAIRDGLVEKTPPDTGERAWWVVQSLCRVPPSHWQERFGVSSDVLIAAAEDSDWMWQVIEGWTHGFLLHGSNSVWALALWHIWSKPRQQASERQQDRRDDLRAKLAPHVPRGELEQIASRLLSEQQSDFPMSAEAVLAVLTRPWSTDLSKTYLNGLRAFVSSSLVQTTDFEPWSSTLEAAALSMPVECFAAALEPFQLPEGNIRWDIRQFHRQLDNFSDAIRLRQRLWEEIPL